MWGSCTLASVDSFVPVTRTVLAIIVKVILTLVPGVAPYTYATPVYCNTYCPRYSSDSYSHSHPDTGPQSFPVHICYTCLLQYLFITGTILTIIVKVILTLVPGVAPYTYATRVYCNTYCPRYSSDSYSHSHIDTGIRSCPIHICHTCLLQYLLVPGTVMIVIVTAGSRSCPVYMIHQSHMSTAILTCPRYRCDSYSHSHTENFGPRSCLVHVYHTCLLQYLLVPGTVPGTNKYCSRNV